MTYTILRNGKRYNNKKFASYESARKTAIKMVRKLLPNLKVYPSLKDCGFSIRRKAA